MFKTNTFVPLYYQLKQHIESQIRSGTWQPGDQVPAEAVLGEKFHISRTTVRQALGELVNQGMLTRVQGKGTFVAHPRIRQRLSRLSGFTEDFQARRMKPSSQILHLGLRLDQSVDLALDNGGFPGEALIELGDFPCCVAPSSTVICALL